MSYTASAIIIYLTPKPPIIDLQHAIISTSKNWLSEHKYSNELILYHYTNLKGLEGIIKERAIRCTLFNYLNDPLELQYGKEIIIQKLKYYSNKEKNLIIKEFLNYLIEESRYLGISPSHSIFVASFCENENIMTQWRGYAAKGCGYNLGISFNSETKSCPDIKIIKNPIKFYLRKVIYDIDKQENIIERYISELIEALNNSLTALSKYPKFDEQTILSQVRLSFKNLLVDIMISLKNPVYAAEKEWRLIRVILWNQLAPIIKFRDNNDDLVPFVNTLLFDENNGNLEFPLTKIKFGPMLDENKTNKSLRLFIDSDPITSHIFKLKNDIPIEAAG